MLEKFRNIFQVPELRRRILFTLALFVVYRLGEHVPTPGVNAKALAGLPKNGLFFCVARRCCQSGLQPRNGEPGL